MPTQETKPTPNEPEASEDTWVPVGTIPCAFCRQTPALHLVASDTHKGLLPFCNHMCSQAFFTLQQNGTSA